KALQVKKAPDTKAADLVAKLEQAERDLAAAREKLDKALAENKALQAKKAPDTKVGDLTAKLEQAEREVAAAQKKADASAALVRDREAKLGAASKRLKEMEGRLQEAGEEAARLKQAVSRDGGELVAARDRAQAILDEAAKLLKEQKYLPADAGRA